MATLADLAVKVGVDNSGVDKGTAQIESKFAKTWRNVAKGAAVAGAAMGVGLTKGLVDSMQVEAASDKLAAQIRLDPAQQAVAGRIAGDLYARAYGESIGDINNTFAAVFREVGDIGEAGLADVTEHAQRFADVFQVDTALAVKTAGALVKNDMAPDMISAFDTITAAAQDINIPAEELLDNLNEYAEPLASLGVDGPKAVGLLNAALDAGVRNTDKALDAVKEFSIRAIDGSELTASAYKTLGLNADEMAQRIAAGGPSAAQASSEIIRALLAVKDPVAQDAAGVALFGTMWEDMGPKAIGALDPMAAGMVDVTGRSAELDAAFDNQAGKLETWRRQAEQMLQKAAEAPGALGSAGAAVVGFGAVAAGSGADLGGMALAVQGVGKAAKAMKLGTAVSKLGQLGKAALTGAGNMAKAAGSFVLNAAKMAASMAVTAARVVAGWVLMGVQSLIQAARMAIAWLIAMGPIALVIAAVIGLVALIILNWDKVVAFLKAAWEAIKTAFNAAVEFIRDLLGKWFTWVNERWDAVWAAVKGAVSGAWEWIKDKVRAGLDFVRERFTALVDFVKGLPGKISSAASGMWDGIKAAFKAAVNWLIRKWNDFSLTLGGGSVLGLDIPSVTLNTPNIPLLAAGGIVPATPGGRLVGVAEGGQDEAVAPVPALRRMIRDAVQDARGGDATPEIHVYVGDREITDIVRVEMRGRDRQVRRRTLAGAGNR